jgi:mRNA-degrading endonuclease RelE of RelBE toxin-antitoxin system
VKREVLLSSHAQREFTDLDNRTRDRIRSALERFASSGRGDLKNLRGVRGGPDLYRLRVGDYRVVLDLSPTQIKVTRIIHRGEGYVWL